MKKISTAWKSSKRPGKQRKYRANLGLHLRRRLMNANLSKELRKKYGRRSIPVRKGDIVKIMKGKFKKKTGKVTTANTKKLFVEIEGMQIKKQDGSKANMKFRPSFLQITELNEEDKRRMGTKKAVAGNENQGKEMSKKTEKGENKNAP